MVKKITTELYPDECEDTEIPLCPYCGSEYHGDEDEDIELIDRGPAQDVQCLDCGKEFSLKMKIKYLFTTEPAEGWGKPESNA
jgi:uncharacterized Zn-finger protein